MLPSMVLSTEEQLDYAETQRKRLTNECHTWLTGKPKTLSVAEEREIEPGGLCFITLSLFQNHEENLCPEYPVSCPNKCLQIISRTEVIYIKFLSVDFM